MMKALLLLFCSLVLAVLDASLAFAPTGTTSQRQRLIISSPHGPKSNSAYYAPPSHKRSTLSSSSLFSAASAAAELEAVETPPSTSSGEEDTTEAGKLTPLEKFKKGSAIFCNLFPVWTLITAGVALTKPAVFSRVNPNTFTAQIGLLMLCMGINLKPSDFKRVFQRPGAVLLAFVGCYGVMPALALALSSALRLGPSLSAGLVLVACINGAQASNLCTYIGQGDLALSVLMTTMTTIGAIVMTPLVGKLLLGTVVPVNAMAIAWSTVQVVLAPILLGMGINANFPKVVQSILPFSPIVGVLITCLLVGVSVSGCAAPILGAGFKLQAAAALLHMLGGLCGYMVTKPFYGEDVCRTFAIEFAMKSSAFGYLLATLHFSEFAVRVPSAVSIVWMTLIGSTMAVVSRFFPPEECVVVEEDGGTAAAVEKS
mmetsp:Transcript_14510/g.21344  ORF Transcript_14510/g.21344 Transcript_14510/m.21344 type:complete len:428 (-) Transcript_14510:418-1701(-)|eukprot:CAMPEP_0194055692 /NCGR_PEP_ID=MMETSP0009_2-20130614/57593_1 /TAXON_ID=210454 /ORGANISM="Grammatophora oceanica, Strain CCMP 410" /LENGTH=427 /DNA_ID=CAMNT_0038704713 /DNA_START=41 /DNA_END=1324 /DNA_ORIENTATION=-